MAKRTTSVQLDEMDERAIRAIRERWGAPSLNAAVSYALRVVARVGEVRVPPGPWDGEKRTTVVRFDEADDEALRSIRRRWPLSSDGAAVSFALRVLAEAERLEIVAAAGPEPE